MSEVTPWEKLSTEEKNVLIAEKIFGYETGRMPSGDMSMWNVTGLVEPIPNYIGSMDTAWVVLQKMAGHQDGEVFYRFRQLLFNDSGDEIYPATDLLLDMATWTPETICKAAWESVR